jgi:hypothetical protein
MDRVERFWHSLWRRKAKEEAKQLEKEARGDKEVERGAEEVTLPEEGRSAQLGNNEEGEELWCA